MDLKYNAIILSKKDVGEADRIYSMYTLEEGKVRIMGKGVRKPNAKLAGNLEPITYSEVFAARSRGKGNITGAIAVDHFSYLKADLSAVSSVFYVFGIIDRLVTQQEKDEALFALILEYLEIMDRICRKEPEEEKISVLTLGLLFKMLDLLGYRFEVSFCVNCSGRLAAENNFFSVEKGGILCGNCARSEMRKTSVKSSSIKMLRIFLANDIRNLVKIKAEKRDIDNLKVAAAEAISWITG